MTDEERSIQKNKKIITVAVLTLAFAIVAVILLKSTLNDTFYFHYIQNQKTGENIGLIVSILGYLLLWWLLGMLPSACLSLFSLCLYYFLHRKDKEILSRHYHPKYETECSHCAYLSFTISYIATFVLLVLHIFNIATINIF